MATTAELTINSESWTQVPLDGPFVAIQIQSTDRVLVHVGNALPVDSSNVGLLVAHNSPGVPSSFAAGGLPAGANVYLKVTDDSGERIVTYATY